MLSATGAGFENEGQEERSASLSVGEPGAIRGEEHAGTEGAEHSETFGAGQEDRIHGDSRSLGKSLSLYSVFPFVGILLSIALFPLLLPRIWHRYYPVVSLFWALVFAVPFLVIYGNTAVHEILHIYLVDYIPFIILLWGLYTISGGIMIEGTLKGTPSLNLGFLLFGTIIASWIGTTGASMLLIRPVLRANAWRERKIHIIIFFIFLVSNVGGSLTPLGDPPLFLGFLHGVPFFWTFFNLFPHMLLVSILILVLFFLLDMYHYRREERNRCYFTGEKVPLRVRGLHNLLFLAGVVGAVLASGMLHLGEAVFLGTHLEVSCLSRDGMILLMGILSMATTAKRIREKNEFTWFPIKEVAYLFAGIFMTIIPALSILKAGQEGKLGFIIEEVKLPIHYFWVTGLLSSFLDNAPTYLTFMNTALGSFYANLSEADAIGRLIREQAVYLQAISAGAVFMGANTYIGNAPNFMVKSIAEQYGLPMPSFFGYMFRYSIPILFPIFVVVTLVFFWVGG